MPEEILKKKLKVTMNKIFDKDLEDIQVEYDKIVDATILKEKFVI